MIEYRVVAVSLLGKKKYKISLEGTEMVTLSLYPSELRRFNIVEGNIISEVDYSCIEELLYKRGKERALYYLKTSDKTAFQMRSKLKEGLYPENIIKKVMGFLEEYRYIDDLRYAEQFISYNKHRKSYQQIKNSLRLKGIDKECIDTAFLKQEDTYSEGENPQISIIRTYIERKLKPDMDIQGKNKIIIALVRKGFKYDDIVSEMKKLEKKH